MHGLVNQAIGAMASVTLLGAGLTGAGAGAGGPSAPADTARLTRPATAYVVNTSASTVIPLNLGTNTVGRTIKVGFGPDAIVFSPDGKTAYVADAGYASRRSADTVAVIDTKTNTVGRFIKVAPRPSALVVTPTARPSTCSARSA
jgi:YVTN family beta-propeller protein